MTAEGDDPSPEFVAGRWVRIRAEVSCDGVWCREAIAWEATDLPVSLELRRRLIAWSLLYDDLEMSYGDWHDRRWPWFSKPTPPDPSDPNPNEVFDWGAFSAEGWAIARALKAELPDWTVIYYDSAQREAPDRIGVPIKTPDYIIQPEPLEPLLYTDERRAGRLSPEQIGVVGCDEKKEPWH